MGSFVFRLFRRGTERSKFKSKEIKGKSELQYDMSSVITCKAIWLGKWV